MIIKEKASNFLSSASIFLWKMPLLMFAHFCASLYYPSIFYHPFVVNLASEFSEKHSG